jgi:hypothetical protein
LSFLVALDDAGIEPIGVFSMKMHFLILLFALVLVGCAEEESSTCEPGGTCEQFMLVQCECCGDPLRIDGANPDLVSACQQDKSSACATGRLTVTQSPETCADNLAVIQQYRDADMDFCGQIEQDQLEALCFEAVIPQEIDEE